MMMWFRENFNVEWNDTLQVSAGLLTHRDTHAPVLLASLETMASEARVASVLIHAGGRVDDPGRSYHAVFEWHFSGLKLEIRFFNVCPPSRSQNNPGKRM